MVIIKSNIEKVVKEGDLNKFSHKTTAQDFKGWVTGWISTHARKGNIDMVFVFQEVLKAYNHFEKLGIGKAKSWKGKSGIIEVIKEPDKVIIYRARKDEPDGEAKKVSIEISKQELNAMITSLNMHLDNQPIKTPNLFMTYSKVLNLGHSSWDSGFKPLETDRKLHNKLTTLLSFLEEENLIKYSRKGSVRIINNKLSVQEILNI